MRIGFDLDSTLLNFQLGVVKVMKAIYHREGKEVIPVEDPGYDVDGIIEGVTKEESDRLKEENLGWFCLEEEPVEGALDVLTELKRRGHELFVVTARHPEEFYRVMGFSLFKIQEFTRAQVNFWFPGIFKDIILDQNKVSVCVELGLDVLVEDDLKHVSALEGFATVPILMDYVYNREYPGLRVKTLEELLPLIESLEKKREAKIITLGVD